MQLEKAVLGTYDVFEDYKDETLGDVLKKLILVLEDERSGKIELTDQARILVERWSPNFIQQCSQIKVKSACYATSSA